MICLILLLSMYDFIVLQITGSFSAILFYMYAATLLNHYVLINVAFSV